MRRLLLQLLTLSILLCVLAAVLIWQDWQASLARRVQVPEPGLAYTIPSGAHFGKVADDLYAHGIIDRPHYLTWEARRTGQAARIKAGEYRILPDMNTGRLINLFVNGPVVQYSLTLLEGWTFRQVRSAVEGHEILIQTLTGLPDPVVMEWLGDEGRAPEGLFLPETYRFPRGTTDLEFLRRAHSAMATLLQREWSERAPDLPFDQPYEALILASIIERETGRPDERGQIAGVFVRRLRKGMRLQTDPTVIYGLGDSFDGNLRRKDLRRDTPYNTYTRSGLPPTPIAMPGAEAIRAAMHPEPGTTLYFVAKGDGGHQFSDTLKEHQRAVARYQLGGRQGG